MNLLFWLVTTDHLTDKIWFKDDEDFKKGMNIVAVLAAAMNVKVISFILMSNHVHFVLWCDRELADEFIRRFKKMYSQHYSKKYGPCGFLHGNKVDIQPLVVGDESFERGVAYVQMNCVAAKICLYPTQYPWGTGNTFFNVTPIKGQRVGDLSSRACERLLQSKLPVPDDYVVDERGFVNPASYVLVEFVESVFRSPKRMDYFLKNSSKAKRLNESGEAPSFNDQLINSAIHDLSVSLFRKNGIEELNDTQCAELFRQIRFRFSSDPAQIARVCGKPYEKVCDLLDSF